MRVDRRTSTNRRELRYGQEFGPHSLQRLAIVESEPYILFVDDNLDDVEIARWHLSKIGIQIEHTVANSEQELRAVLSERQPSVIVSDLCLPLFDGWSALRVAQALAPAAPFILHSARITEEDRRLANDRGAFGCVEKHQFENLALLVKKALNEKVLLGYAGAPANSLWLLHVICSAGVVW